MRISIIGTNCADRTDALTMSGLAAGICYMSNDYRTLSREDMSKTLARANMVLKSGHHSCFDHVYCNILIEDIPKILAMVLNNEGAYATSEKSGRYTTMNLSGIEKELYEKWVAKFVALIERKYGVKMLNFYGSDKKTARAITKLAMENARYMTSVFTPATMLYSVTLRQLNYILNFFDKFCQKASSDFEKKLAEAMKDFSAQIPDELKIEGLNANAKGREISLFATETKQNTFSKYFGDVYSTCYSGSFAEYAQAQRHRTLRYSMFIPSEPSFYIPPILEGADREEWYRDILKVKDLYPQGMKVMIYESGTLDDFILKCYERICGCAQLEICEQTLDILNEYMNLTSSPEVKEKLRDYTKGARCTFPCFKCESRCVWGAKDALTRNI